mmetsp:Transcript_10181/g.13614  ORF Transcript_10181/g.13614 Transcript_10181/m.13614 type:complete len:208 (-) Transcript_10181:1022-1645(-)
MLNDICSSFSVMGSPRELLGIIFSGPSNEFLCSVPFLTIEAGKLSAETTDISSSSSCRRMESSFSPDFFSSNCSDWSHRWSDTDVLSFEHSSSSDPSDPSLSDSSTLSLGASFLYSPIYVPFDSSSSIYSSSCGSKKFLRGISNPAGCFFDVSRWRKTIMLCLSVTPSASSTLVKSRSNSLVLTFSRSLGRYPNPFPNFMAISLHCF